MGCIAIFRHRQGSTGRGLLSLFADAVLLQDNETATWQKAKRVRDAIKQGWKVRELIRDPASGFRTHLQASQDFLLVDTSRELNLGSGEGLAYQSAGCPNASFGNVTLARLARSAGIATKLLASRLSSATSASSRASRSAQYSPRAVAFSAACRVCELSALVTAHSIVERAAATLGTAHG